MESHLPAIIELPHLQSEDVRLADDFEPWRVEVESFLRSRGFVHIFEARDGLKAVEKALEINPDIAILDLGMPGLNGIQVTDTLRQLSPQSKVIILTQDSDKEVRKAALERGAVAFVLKTHMAADLIPAIRAVLGIRAKGASS